jgi:hypothetical protein
MQEITPDLLLKMSEEGPLIKPEERFPLTQLLAKHEPGIDFLFLIIEKKPELKQKIKDVLLHPILLYPLAKTAKSCEFLLHFLKEDPSIIPDKLTISDFYDTDAPLDRVSLFAKLIRAEDKGIELCELMLRHLMSNPFIQSTHLFAMHPDATSNLFQLVSSPRGMLFLQSYFPPKEDFDNAAFANTLCPKETSVHCSGLFMLCNSDEGLDFIRFLIRDRPEVIRAITVANWLAPARSGDNNCAGRFIIKPENAAILDSLPPLTAKILKMKLNPSANKSQFFASPVQDGALVTEATGLNHP